MTIKRSVLVIQSDWNDTLRNNDNTAWILRKPLGEKAEYGKVGGSSSDGIFTLHSRTERTLSVTHEASGLSTIFVAPVAEFNQIHKKNVACLDAASGGLGVSVCSENKLVVWESETGLVRRSLQGHLFDVYTCRFFPSGVVVLSGGGDMQLRIWDAATGSCPVILQGHTSAVLDTAIVDRGKNIISVSKDGMAKLWNCAQAKCIATILSAESTINCCAISDVTGVMNLPSPMEEPGELEICTSGKLLLTGCEDGKVYLVGVESRSIIGVFPLGENVLSACFVTATVGVVGLNDGRLMAIDAAVPSSKLLSHDSASPVESLVAYKGGVLVGRHDGVCQFYHLDGTSPHQLTGSDCDPIYKISYDCNNIYTACRDGIIRKYRNRDLNV